MKTERLQAQIAKDIQRAAEFLRTGETVAFPTETVYGLGANALSPEAVEKIFVAKQRPHWDPLIVHVAERSALDQICAVDKLAERLIEKFWPGPLTLLLPRTPAIPDAVTAGRALVGVRIPAHPVAQELLRLAGVPVAAPSANRFGHTSPTTAAHVLADLDGRIAAVLDGGPTQVGVESTVAEVRAGELIVYRAGAVTTDMLQQIAPVELYRNEGHARAESLPSPGVGIRHYAPRARLLLVRGAPGSLCETIEHWAGAGERVGVLLPDGWVAGPAAAVFAWGDWRENAVLAQRLFAGLRELDERGATVIVCPLPEAGGLGDALRDRLEKAAREE